MMKKLLIFTLLATTLFAKDLQPLYKDGLKAFNNKEFDKSFKIFNELFSADSANPQFNYYLGRSAYEIGLYEKAISAYDRVLIIDESHFRSKLERGRAYVATMMYDEAKLDLEEVLAQNPPSEVRENIKILLELMEKKVKKNFINWFLSLGVGYDTNVNANPSEELLIDYLADTQNLPRENITAEGEISDKFIQESFNIHHTYDYGDKGGFFIDNSLMIYNQNYLDSSDYNVLFTSLSSGLGYMGSDYKLLLPIGFDKIIYGGDSLLSALSFTPNIIKPISENLFFSGYLKFQRKYYSKEADKLRDTNLREVGVGVIKNFNSHIFNLKYSFTNEDKTKSSDVEFIDKDMHSIKFSYSKNISDLCNLNLEYLLRKSKYETSVNGKKRDDDYKSYLIKLSRDIDKFKYLTFSYNYIDAKSNYIPMVYDKSIYLLNFNINF